MANLIDSTYFDSGLRTIPNVQKPTVFESLEIAITYYQEKFLREQFGYEFQKLMLSSPTEPIYSNILNGVEWTDSEGNLQKWDGIAEPLADYIYFYYIKENIIKLDGVGYTAGNVENGQVIAAITIPVNVYNRFVTAINQLYDYLYTSEFDYSKVNWKTRTYINEFGI